MLDCVTNMNPLAVAYVDDQGSVVSLHAHSRLKGLQLFCGKKAERLIHLIFGQAGQDIVVAYRLCASSLQPVQIQKHQHQSRRQLTEYFDWNFFPGPAKGSVIICVQDITENVFLEQEFTAVSLDNEVANRELHAAISDLDFRLMDLDQAHKRLAALYRITSIIQRTVNEQEVLDDIVAGIATEMGFPVTAILLVDEARQELVTKASKNYNHDLRVPFGCGITWQAIERRELVYIPDISIESGYYPTGNQPGVSEIVIPLLLADRVIGVIDIETFEERPVQPYDLNLLGSLAGQVALTIAHVQHVSHVEVQANTDGLTGLYNYRYFITLMEKEFKRALRFKRPLALLMLDIDYFKIYNDTNGHPLGNEVLKIIAEIMKSCCRDVDVIVRYGGEEFAVLFPETTMTEAHVIAERIRLTIAQYPFKGRQTQPEGILTVSIGIAAYPEDALVEKDLIDHADAALYSAKRTRNCSIIHHTMVDSKRKNKAKKANK
jgi:diguanylate cyclase (GGDEF)-like protein